MLAMASFAMNPISLLPIRADASAEMGTGHVMRMLALAQAWRDVKKRDAGDPGRVCFVCAQLPEALEQRLHREGCEVVRIDAKPGSEKDLEQTLAALTPRRSDAATHPHPHTPTWFVLDGYAFGLMYQRAIRAAGYRLLLVDDYNHLPEYECDLLLNQNIGAEEYTFRTNADAELLLGPRYALLRHEFLLARKTIAPRPVSSCPRNVLVTMGGSDLHGMTRNVVAALVEQEGEPLHIKVVAGAAATISESELGVRTNNGHEIELLRNVEDMPSLMQWADIAVSAAGSTCWELLCFGVPTLVVIVAENQERIARSLQERGLAINLGWYNEWDSGRVAEQVKSLFANVEQRRLMGLAAVNTVDGCGAERVVKVLCSEALTLRPVVMDDAHLLWVWANDSSLRAQSFTSEKIPWQTHLDWLEAKLSDAQSVFLLAEARGRPVGVARIEKKGMEAVISVSICSEERGKGLGNRVIALASRAYTNCVGRSLIHAYIKSDNSASRRAFEHAGYRFDADTKCGDQPAVRYVWSARA